MKMKSKTKRVICRLLSTLAVLTILCQIPAGAAALEDITQIATQQITATENATLLKAEDLPANIQNLLPANRQNHSVYLAATEKVDGAYETAELYTLRTEDPLTGTGTLTVHSSPIKYIDDNGDLQFIDTAVKPITTAQRSAADYAYRNTANSFTVEYGSAATTGINFDNAFTFAVKETAAAKKAQEISKTATDKVLYADAFGANTAVEYVNIENGIKENIILSKYTGQTRFDFIFRSETHVPILAEDGMFIWIANKRTPKEPEYRFLDLYAYDSYDPAIHGINEGSNFRHLNEELYYELATNTDGSYTITVVVPEEYLAHPEIVYPVTIDPSITPHTSANSNTHDTFVDAATPTTQENYNLSYVRFGKVNGYKNFGYHRFADMPSLPNGANITSAKLKFTFRSGQNTPSASSGISMWTPRVTAYQWKETTITWNNQPYGDSGPLTNITYNGSYLDYFNADLTAQVRDWYADPASNYGIDFTYSNENYNDYNSVVSAEGDAARAPVLTINYTAPWPEATKPTIKTRADWGARSPVTSQYDQRSRQPQRIVFHHSAQKFSSTDINEIKEEIQRIQDLHMIERGWQDIGYNFIIDPAGNIWTGHTLSYKSSHAYGYNDDIGVLILGDFESRYANFWSPNTLNQSQKDAIINLSKWLCYEYGLSKSNNAPAYAPISTHRELMETDCPGENAGDWIEGSLRSTINTWGVNYG